MSRQERIKKPEPERQEPIRNWSTLFNASVRTAETNVPGARYPQGPGAGPTILQSVANGYRVIDEYLNKGQESARSIWTPPGPRTDATTADGQRALEDIGRQTMQLANLWLDLVTTMWPAGAPAREVPPPGVAGPFSIGATHDRVPSPDLSRTSAPESPRASESTFAIDITSSRRIEVLVDLRAGSSARPLRVHDLRTLDADAPRLSGVAITHAAGDDHLTIRLCVPVELPAGVYTGMVIDEETGLPRGTLTVRIPKP